MSSFDKSFARAAELAREAAANRRELKRRCAPVRDLIDRSSCVVLTSEGDRLMVEFEVDSFADGADLLEAFESRLGIEFTKTFDQAEYGWREYIAPDAPWLRVDLRPKAGSEVCRRVVVGEKREPIYGFDCGGAREALERAR